MSDNNVRIKSIDNMSIKHDDSVADDDQPLKAFQSQLVSRKRSCVMGILVIVASFIMGGLGGLFFDYLLLSKIPLLENSDLVQVGESRVTIQRGEKVIVDNDSIVKDLRKNVSNSIVGIRKEVKKSSAGQINIESEFLGHGVILTADGLIVTSANVLTDRRASYQVVNSEGTVYRVENIIDDPASEIALVKIQANNLSVAELDSTGARVGQTLYALATDQLDRSQAIPIVVEAEHYQVNFPADSEKIENYFRSSIKNISSGSPLFDYQGKLTGIKVAQNDESMLIFSVADVKAILGKVIAENKITRLELGIRYVNLNDKIAKVSDLSRTQGLLIYSKPGSGRLAVKSNGPAAIAGLKANDIIIKIGDVEIDNNYLLPQSLSEYSTEEPIEITYWRDNQELKTQATLKEIKQVK